MNLFKKKKWSSRLFNNYLNTQNPTFESNPNKMNQKQNSSTTGTWKEVAEITKQATRSLNESSSYKITNIINRAPQETPNNPPCSALPNPKSTSQKQHEEENPTEHRQKEDSARVNDSGPALNHKEAPATRSCDGSQRETNKFGIYRERSSFETRRSASPPQISRWPAAALVLLPISVSFLLPTLLQPPSLLLLSLAHSLSAFFISPTGFDSALPSNLYLRNPGSKVHHAFPNCPSPFREQPLLGGARLAFFRKRRNRPSRWKGLSGKVNWRRFCWEKKRGVKPSFDTRAEPSPDLPISKVDFRGQIRHFELTLSDSATSSTSYPINWTIRTQFVEDDKNTLAHPQPARFASGIKARGCWKKGVRITGMYSCVSE